MSIGLGIYRTAFLFSLHLDRTSTLQFPHLKNESVGIYSIYFSGFPVRLKLDDVYRHDLQKYKVTHKCAGLLLEVVFLGRVNLIIFVFYLKPCPLVYMPIMPLPVHEVNFIFGETLWKNLPRKV